MLHSQLQTYSISQDPFSYKHASSKCCRLLREKLSLILDRETFRLCTIHANQNHRHQHDPMHEVTLLLAPPQVLALP